MASHHGPRFASSSIFNQNFSPNCFNVNPGIDRPPPPQFQRPPNHPDGRFQSPEGFNHGFQNRHQFSNFPSACGSLNRPPPPLSPTVHTRPPPPHNSVPGPSNSFSGPSHPSFPGPSNPPFSGPTNPSFPGPTNPPFTGPRNPSFSGPANPPFTGPANPPFTGPANPPFTGPANPPFTGPSNPPFSGPSNPPFSGPSNPSFSGPANPPFSGAANPPFSGSANPSFSGPANSALTGPANPSFPGPANPPLSGPANPPFPGPANPSFPGPANSPFPGTPQPPFPGASHPPFPSHPNSPRHFSGSSNSVNAPFCGSRDSQPRFPGSSTSFHHPLPSRSPAPSHSSFECCPSQPPPLSHHSVSAVSFSQRPFSPERSFSSCQSSTQRNQHSNFSHPHQQNQYKSISHPPHQHQGYRLNSQSPASRPRFDNSLNRPYKHWHQMTTFSGPRTPFSNQSPNIVKPHQFKDGSRPVSKKKEKSRDFRKLKDDSTEKPYYCDTCDRAFVTENELNEHLSLHIKCDYEDCNFKAHPKIVMLHQKMQHETGYAERISKLKDDAEVKKWREERRKRFPTAENIRKRKAEQAEREARGEVLETKEFGKFKRRKEETRDITNDRRQRVRGHRVRRKNFRSNYHEYHPGFQQQRFKANPESDSDSDSHISLNMFSGLTSLSNSAEETNHTDEIVEPEFSEQNLSKATQDISQNHLNVSHSENNLISTKTKSQVRDAEKLRGSEKPAEESVLEIPDDELEKPNNESIVLEDSDDEGPEVIPISKSQDVIYVEEKDGEIKSDVNSTAKVSDLNHEDAGKRKEKIRSNASNTDSNDALPASNVNQEGTDRGKEKIRSNASNTDRNNVLQASNVNQEGTDRTCQSRRHFDKRENNFSTEKYAAKQVRKNSLLEKLLADDIRHERNIILQCIRHIVNNNFFGLAVKKS